MGSKMKGTGTKLVIEWRPEKDKTTPVYKQIVDYIGNKIISGDYVIGTKLPSQRELAKQFNVNRSTIVTAMEELSSYGIIESDGRNGTKITNTTWLPDISLPPDWSKYVKSGVFSANKILIQTINHYEADSDCIQLSTEQLSKNLLPTSLFKKILSQIPSAPTSLDHLEPLGFPFLRSVIADRLFHDKKISTSPSCVLITSGQRQALQLVSHCLLKAESTIFTENLSYLYTQRYFSSLGMNLKGIPMDQEGICHWRIHPEHMKNQDALLYTMPNFQNPTGICMSAKRRRELFDFCQKSRLPIIESDVYGNLYLDEKPPLPLKSYDGYGMVLYAGSINKEISAPHSLGFLVAPESVVERLADMKLQLEDPISFSAQWALARLLSSDEYDLYLDRLRHKLKEQRDLVLSLLDKYFAGIASWSKPEGGFFIWLKFEGNLSTEQLFRKALEQGILILPGSFFSMEKNNCIRISYSYASEQELKKGLRLLSEIAKSMIKQ